MSASSDGTIVLWDLSQKGKDTKALAQVGIMNTPPGKTANGQILTGIVQVLYNQLNEQLLVLGLDKRVTYWDLTSCSLLRQLQASYETDVNCMALSSDGELVVVGDETGEVKVFTYADCRLVHIETVHSAGVSAISISPDNTLILTADEIGHIYFWRI